MGLNDTSPLTTEIDGLDSGLGEAPPTYDKKMYSPTKVENSSLQTALMPDKDKHPHLRTPSKKLKKDLEPDKILDQKQKKSLEKVAEWLMKVPSEQSLEEDGNDFDSCSSTSTIDLGQRHCETNLTRTCAKALEDQVFGAIYRRERRGKGIVKPTEAALEMVSLYHSVKNTSEDKSRNYMEGEHSIREQENNANSNILKEEIGALEGCSRNVEPTNMAEDDQNYKNEVLCLGSDVEQQQKETNAKRRVRTSLQEVDSDLLKCTQKKPENAGKKKSTQRGSKSIKTDKAKSARMSTPLVLVTVQNVETSPKIRPGSEEVQVHIENYPSSGDQDVPLARSTRRSRRLQVFTKQDDKEELSKSSVLEKVHNSKYPDFKCEILDNFKSRDSIDQTQQADRNGCIHKQDIQEIENVDSGKRASPLREDTKMSLSEVPHKVTLSETAFSVAVVPSCAAIAPVEPNNQLPNTTQLVTELTEMEHEQKNDTELDTQQLVRSFKATKRKSFYLCSGPNIKRTHLLIQENNQSPVTEENLNDCSADESSPKQMEPIMAKIINNQDLTHVQNMSGNVLISPSCSPSLKRKALGLHNSCSVEAGNCVLGSSASSPLPPNNESKHEVQISSPLIPTNGNSVVCFATEKPQISESQTDFIMTKGTRGGNLMHSFNGNTSEELLDAQSSLTPDGLGMPEVTYSQGSRELSTCRKTKMAQKQIVSSDSSDCAEEEFPCLTKIFNKTAPPGANPPVCHSPDCVNSSQASVDLFDMPNECKFKISQDVKNILSCFFLLMAS